MADLPEDTEVYEATPEGWAPAEPPEPFGVVYEHYRDEVWGKGLTTGLGEVLAHLLGIENLGTVVVKEKDLPYCDPGMALERLNRPKWICWDPKHLSLVIGDGEGLAQNKVRVGTAQLKVPLMGLHWPRVEALYQGLKARLTEH